MCRGKIARVVGGLKSVTALICFAGLLGGQLAAQGPTDNRFIGNMGLPNSTNEFLIKGDQQLGQSHRLTLDYFQSNGSQLLLPSGSTLGTWAISNYSYRQQTANASDVWTHGSAVNQICSAIRA
jgi:hypothetical protein